MTQARRIKRLPGNPLDPGREVQIRFEGKTLTGFEGETLSCALLAHGIRVFGRSIKYHRPRSPFCLRGHCSSCLMRVDGIPNERTCQIRCREGMKVERQLGWPHANLDVLRTVDWFTPSTLDHHGMFTASEAVNRLGNHFVRQLAGYGAPPEIVPPAPCPFNTLRADVTVIGGGVAGLAVARGLSDKGLEVVLLEADSRLGGRLLDASSVGLGPDGQEISGWSLLSDRPESSLGKSIRILKDTPALVIYPGARIQVIASNARETLAILSRRVVIATGANEQLPLFENNDLAGIFGPRALDRLVCGHGVLPAEPVVLVGHSPRLLRLARLLHEQGVRLSGVVSQRREGPEVEQLKAHGIPLFHDRTLAGARGGKWINRLEFTTGQQMDLVLDGHLCAVEGPEAPCYELAHHAGCRVKFCSETGFEIVADEEGRTSHGQIMAAGHCRGARDIDEAQRQGEKAAAACLASLHTEGADSPAPRESTQPLRS